MLRSSTIVDIWQKTYRNSIISSASKANKFNIYSIVLVSIFGCKWKFVLRSIYVNYLFPFACIYGCVEGRLAQYFNLLWVLLLISEYEKQKLTQI